MIFLDRIPSQLTDIQSDAIEWKIDKDGRRYRTVGNMIEYAPDIVTTRGKFGDMTFKEYNRAVARGKESADPTETASEK